MKSKEQKISFLLTIVAVLAVCSCAHHRDVRPGADGTHRVVIMTDQQEEGTRDAISQAQHFCKSKNLEAAFVNEKAAYKGDLDEQTYKNAKRAATVAKTLGGGIWVGGGKRESDVGGVLGLGGQATDQALGNAYEVAMEFKCQ